MESLEKLLESCEVNVKTAALKTKPAKAEADGKLDEVIKSYCELDFEIKKLDERKKELREQILSMVELGDKSMTIMSSDHLAMIRIDAKHKYTVDTKKLTEAETIQIEHSLHPFFMSNCQLAFSSSLKEKLVDLLSTSNLAFLVNDIETKIELRETGARLTKLLTESRTVTAAIKDAKSYQITALDGDSK